MDREGGHLGQVGLHDALDDNVVGKEPSSALGNQVQGNGKGRGRAGEW